MKHWVEISEDKYQTARLNPSHTRLFRYPNEPDDSTSQPHRLARIWNEMHPDSLFEAFVRHDEELRLGWESPFIPGRESTDKEISDELLNIYQSTGRIVVRAHAPKSFTTGPNGKATCVDVRMALKLGNEMSRAASFESLISAEQLNTIYPSFWLQHIAQKINTIHTIKALLFVQKHRPDIWEMSFLKSYPSLLARLASAYDLESPVNIALDLLTIRKPINFDHLKTQISSKITLYIQNRGEIIQNRGEIHAQSFIPNRVSRWFRDPQTTELRINQAVHLKNKIERATDFETMRRQITKTKDSIHQSHSSTFFKSNLETQLDECLIMISNMSPPK